MSETKSAGVPAGATHVCTKCRSWWRWTGEVFGTRLNPIPGVTCDTFSCRNEDLRPIAEAGPAPTTAAPAERVGDSREDPDFYEGIDFAKPAPAEQPGKAADPRPAQQSGVAMCVHGGLPPHKYNEYGECARPAQPQAPAGPTPEPIEKARKLAMKIFAFHNSGNADLGKETAWVEAHAEHVAAPLREERDRLAERVKDLEKQLAEKEEARLTRRRLMESAKLLQADADAAEAKAAERDARIATLESVLRLWKNVDHALDVSGDAWLPDTNAREFAAAKAATRAALGAPEENT